MGEKDDYLTTYRVFFENFAANVDPEDQLPVNIAGYTISEAELPGEVIYWTTQYLSEKECPLTLMTPLQRIILDEVHVARKQSPNEFGYDPEISEYLALRLMQAVTARVNDVCLRYLDNAQLDTLPPPPPPSMRQFLTAASVTKNLRRAMEDRHFEIGNLEALFGIETTEPTSFYGVYDGHAGSAAAVYCAAHLHQYLVESPHFTTDLRRALEDAFLRTDAEFIRKTNQKRVSGGSTAVVICVRGRKLVAAWAGDSLALLAKRLKLMQLVHPHKPDRPDEKQRIVSSGGEVRFWGTWRVDGQLAVSRAIGDAQYKPYVTAQPETAEVELDGDEDFVVVACDGLWDFVSEDVVALVVYKQLVNDSNDLKEVTKNLVRQAKRQGSQDNISVIVVFLKEPRDIAAENTAPMEIGLDNPVVNPPPFSVENDVCKVSEGTGGCADVENDVSDSDSDDLGPETAVDIDADELDADARREPAAPTPPAHTVEESHIDGNLVDNVAESGEESEDEWNYYKGEGEREDNPGEEIDDVLRSETPGHDHSAWESSSVDMNSSPLNPDAPVFVPGSVAGCDQLLAESPRKPLPMDDIELPDVAQFQTEAHIRPAELHDLDDCDQLNGHHNLSMEGVTEHMNGNSKNNMDSLGFGFNLGIEQDKIKETSLIQDFERIQKDTTDFCNIQVFQAHETNPFSRDGDNQLFERLKNKESDPMSMSFYQEKDDDTCDRFNKPSSQVDLNAVQLLPESDDEDIPSNGICQGVRDYEKENINPEFRDTDILDLNNGEEPNNDIMRFEDNAESLSNDFVNFNVDSLNNMQDYTNNDFECNLPQDSIVHTETPESHKLLFEQIPEIPDGKSSELGFSNEDNLDVSESEKDARVLTPQDETSQDVQMDSKIEDSTSEGINQDQIIPTSDLKNSTNQCSFSEVQNDFGSEISVEELEITQKNALKPEAVDQDEQFDTILGEVNHENIVVDVHQDSEIQQNGLSEEDLEIENISDQIGSKESNNESLSDNASLLPKSPVQQSSILSEENNCLSLQQESSLPISPKPSEEFVAHDVLQSPVPCESPVPYESEIHLEPSESHLTQDPLMEKQTLLPSDPCPLPSESPVHHKDDTLENFETNTKSPTLFNPKIDDASETVHTLISSDPSKSLVIEGAREPSPAPAPSEIPLPRESPIPSDSPQPEESQLFGSVMFSQSKSGIVASSNILVDEEELIESHDSINVKKESEELIADKITPVNTEIVTNLLGNEEIILETSKELSQNEFIHEKKDMKQPAQEVLIENIISDVTRHDVISPNPIQDGITSQPVELVASPIPTPIDTSHEIEDIKQSEKLAMEGGAPTPDIVPEGHNRAEIITDIDIDISESHAQEICVPVTSEIQPNDAVMSGVTPSSTSDVENTHSSTEPLGDAPIAAPLVAAAAGAAAVAAIGAGVAKTKSGSPKKAPTAVPSKTTPKTTPKAAPTSSRTPASATKRPVSTTTAPRSPATTARPATARTPTSATKPIAKPTTKSTAPSPKPVASPTAPVAKTTSKPSQTLPSARSVAAPKPAAARAAQKPSAPKPTVTATKTGTAPATKAAVPAPRAAPRPAPIRAPLSSAPPKPVKDLKLKAPEAKKPQTNGDVKISAKPAAARVPAARPQAPRPAPRVPSAAPVPAKPAAPKAPVRVALDKQSKDLANKRITAKAAPPRTATAKVPANTNNAPKPIKKVADKKAVLNGTASQKQPPSPPPTDNALLPDVIA